ncbi:MAG: glycosyltransferase family 2 protein [Deltaproteobacteria bacterium]|nr:glycosyltransferase family 2 protein [Deltaproteobacteria bacterium]
MIAPHSFAIVIPTFNHGGQVRGVVEKALRLGKPVIVVDDGSTDSTPQILASLSGITLIRHKENQGKGAALLTGFTEASRLADWAVTIDADGQHAPEDIPFLIKAIPEGQRLLVIGKRLGMEQNHVPWTSLWGRKFSNFWVWASCGKWFSDSQSGFRVYPLPEILHLRSRARRYQFEVEIMVLAVWSGLPIIEVPVSVLYGPAQERVSHFRPWQDFWRNTRTFSRLIAARILIPSRRRK